MFCFITMHLERIEFSVFDDDSKQTVARGSNPLTMTNGCYDSLLSNTINEIQELHGLCVFQFRKA